MVKLVRLHTKGITEPTPAAQRTPWQTFQLYVRIRNDAVDDYPCDTIPDSVRVHTKMHGRRRTVNYVRTVVVHLQLPIFSLETHFGFKVNFVKIFPRLDAGMLLLNGAPISNRRCRSRSQFSRSENGR
jgi:hypothetical protein